MTTTSTLRYVVELMLICVLSLCCGGVAADVRYDFALLPLYGVRLVTYGLSDRLVLFIAVITPCNCSAGVRVLLCFVLLVFVQATPARCDPSIYTHVQ